MKVFHGDRWGCFTLFAEIGRFRTVVVDDM